MASPPGQEGCCSIALLQEMIPDLIGRTLQGFEERHRRALDEHTQTLLQALQASAREGGGGPRGVEPTASGEPWPSQAGLLFNDDETDEDETDEDDAVGGPITPSVLMTPPAHVEDADRSPTSPAQRSCNESSGAFDTDEPSVDDKGRFEWQWLSSSGRWTAYDAASNARIEMAYRRGDALVRLKSGKGGKVPMELFFGDMRQHDPESQRERDVRRQGRPLTRWQALKRHSQALWRGFTSGTATYESCGQYHARRTSATMAHVYSSNPSLHLKELAEIEKIVKIRIKSKLHESRLSSLQKLSSLMDNSPLFNLLGSFIVLLQCWWIWHSTDLYSGTNLYDQGVYPIVWEYFFLVYFTLAFAVRVLALEHRSTWYRDPWILLDLVCALSTWLDVLIVPPINKALGGRVWNDFGGDALRVIRLLKLFRLSNNFGSSQEFNVIIKGTIRGMKSTGYVVVLLAMVLFTSTVLMRAHADNDALSPLFGTMPQAMITLLSRGLFLDGIGIAINALFEAGEVIPTLIFFCFLYVSFFGLLSMLVGAFCTVAENVATKEYEKKELCKISRELEDIAWCYMEAEGDERHSMTYKNFKLFISNPDVRKSLKACQIDHVGVIHVVSALFKTRRMSSIAFAELLALMVHLRVGNPSLTSDIAGLQACVMQGFLRLEHAVESARPAARPQVSSEADDY